MAIVVSIYNVEARLIGNAFKRGDDDTLILGSAITNTKKNCKPFYDSLRKQTGEQFSVFWVGNEDYSKHFMGGFERENLKTGNYLVAARPLEKPTTPPPTTATTSTSATPTATTTVTTTVPTTPTTPTPSNAHHSEPIALAKAEEVLMKYTTDKGAVKPPDVFLYTFNSPCFRTPSVRARGSCATSIAEWAQKHKNSIRYLFVAWDKQYVNNYESQFLNGLVKLTEKDNVKIMYPRDGHFCIPGKDRPWLQRAVHKCLTTNVKVAFPIPGCKDAGIFRRDLAKLINRIVWRCGMAGNIRDKTCWEGKAEQILGKNGIWLRGVEKDIKPDNKKRMNQLQEWRKLFDKSLSDCVSTTGTDIGPAISSKEPSTPSSSAEETKGLDGRDNELCFADKNQSGNLGATANGKK